MDYIYLDFNVLLDVANGLKSIKLGPDQAVVYSNEHFTETARGSNLRPLEVLKNLSARKLELDLDEDFNLTGSGQILGDADPFEFYRDWQDANDDVIYKDQFLPILSRLLGADNHDSMHSMPMEMERNLRELLKAHGLLDAAQSDGIEQLRRDLEIFANEKLVQVPSLERQRRAIGMHGGKAGLLADASNPLEALWALVESSIQGALTADEFFGFAPISGVEFATPAPVLGIIRCYIILNWLGLRPDRGLARTTSLPGIVSDAVHVAHAAFCHSLVSSDARLCAKARAIYSYRKIGTAVVLLTTANASPQRAEPRSGSLS